jgi:hypothetical protein
MYRQKLLIYKNVHAHKVISDAFFLIFKFHEITLIYNYEIQKTDFVPILSWYMQQQQNWENEHVNIHVPLLIT